MIKNKKYLITNQIRKFFWSIFSKKNNRLIFIKIMVLVWILLIRTTTMMGDGIAIYNYTYINVAPDLAPNLTLNCLGNPLEIRTTTMHLSGSNITMELICEIHHNALKTKNKNYNGSAPVEQLKGKIR